MVQRASTGWSRRRACQALAALACPAASALQAAGPAYPERPVRLVLGFQPGGATDALARLLAQKLGDRMGQPFVVDNRPGAATRIGMEAVQKASSDGYTIGLATAVTTTFPLMFDGVSFAPGKDFTPIGMLGRAPSFLIVRRGLAAQDFRSLVELGKAGGRLSFSHPGNGSNPHIACLALAQAQGMNVTAVPYKGTQPAALAVATGETDFALLEHASVRPVQQRGDVRMLAVNEPQRSPLQPAVPSAREAGLPRDIEGLTPWFMLIAPNGTPAAVAQTLNRQVSEILALPEVREHAAALGIEPETGSGEQATAYFNEQRARIARMVGELNLSLKT